MNDSDIDRLLRQETPELTVRTGLETRIRAALRKPPEKKSWKLAWLALPAAAMVALMLVDLSWQEPAPTDLAEIEAAAPPPVETMTALVPEIAEDQINPLRSETRALRNDAERTGRFLLDRLPSLSLAEK